MANAVDRHVGGRLRTLREAVFLTPADLAAATRIDATALREMEAGTRRISAQQLRDLAAALRVEVAAFYRGLADDRCEGAG